MKTIAICLFLGLMMPSLQLVNPLSIQNETSDALLRANFEWSQTAYDFGKIKLNEPVTHEFTFTNNGGETLIISSAQASCGCTVTEYTKEPVSPGAQGYVKATYNAAHAGVFNKTVTINANTDKAVVLTIKGEVVE